MLRTWASPILARRFGLRFKHRAAPDSHTELRDRSRSAVPTRGRPAVGSVRTTAQAQFRVGNARPRLRQKKASLQTQQLRHESSIPVCINPPDSFVNQRETFVEQAQYPACVRDQPLAQTSDAADYDSTNLRSDEPAVAGRGA